MTTKKRRRSAYWTLRWMLYIWWGEWNPKWPRP